MKKLFALAVVVLLAALYAGPATGYARAKSQTNANQLGAPAAQSSNPADVVRTFLDALNRADYDTVRSLSDPSTHYLADPGTPFGFDQTIDQVIDFARKGGERWNVSSLTQTGPDAVVVEASISSTALPPLAHPYGGTSTWKVTNGKVTGFLFISSEQTRNDLAAFAAAAAATSQPGMPKTGLPQQALPIALLAAGLSALALGALIRRAVLQQRGR